jgi:lipopolysaccharide biosynthesis glycosyltransferase
MDLLSYQDIDISRPVVPWGKLKTYDQSKIINIVYVADEKYLPYTYTSLVSILDNSKYTERKEPIRFTIILDEMEFKGILDDDTTRSTNVLFFKFNRDIYKYDIEYIPIPDMERERINQFKTYWWPKFKWPKSIFLKLFFSNFLPYDKCIYLDGDTACVNDIRKLWSVNLGDKCFGACDHNKRHGASCHNAGVILMNLEKMRSVSFASEVEELAITGQKTGRGIPYPLTWYVEETALIEYSQKHTDTGALDLDFKHNVCVSALPMRGSLYDNFANRNLQESEKRKVDLFGSEFLSNPSIIHYYFWEKTTKPWNCVQEYEAAGCPSFEITENNFWKTTWKHNPWAFWVWYKYYKEANL